MKKLIAIAVVFALVAGAAFAEVTLSAAVGGRVSLAKSSNGSAAVSALEDASARLVGTATNEAGTFGGTVRIGTNGFGNFDGQRFTDRRRSDVFGAGFVWWRPLKQFELRLSSGWDDLWDIGGLHGFSDGDYHGGGDSVDMGAVLAAYKPGGAGHAGVFLTVKPLDNLELNVAVPFGLEKGFEAGGAKYPDELRYLSVIRGIQARLRFDLGANIGVLGLTFKGDTTIENEPSVYLSFELKAIPNIPIMMSFGYQLPTVQTLDTGIKAAVKPLGIGLSTKLSFDPFALVFRTRMSFFGTGVDTTSGTAKFTPMPIALSFDLIPSYKLTEQVNIEMGFGLGIKGAPLDGNFAVVEGGTGTVYWRVSSRLWVNVVSGGTVSLGFYVGDREAKGLTWGIPVGLSYSF